MMSDKKIHQFVRNYFVYVLDIKKCSSIGFRDLNTMMCIIQKGFLVKWSKALWIRYWLPLQMWTQLQNLLESTFFLFYKAS